MTGARIVAGNWKMNPPTIGEAVTLARAIVGLRVPPGLRVIVTPPTIALPAVADAARGTAVGVYAQDVHWADGGAFTGQLAAPMLVGVASGTIVGHSEVRRDQGDDDARVAQKLAAALRSGLEVIACVGETEAEYAAGQTAAVLTRQAGALFEALDRADPAGPGGVRSTRLIAIAYEPVWAIGTGRAATAEHAASAAAAIRDRAGSAFGPGAETLSVLYGGSVSAKNAVEFAAAPGIDGALVGGASLKVDEFAAIVAAFGR
ncbi:MAG TPA: triose-phosphate isomerase [Candidatus Limnocylindria bacterium]